MSVTFHPANEFGRPLLRCACDEIPPDDGTSPYIPDSVCAACRASLNVNNRNGADLLAWLSLNPATGLYGIVSAKHLVARCRRRLWPEDRNQDPALEPVSEGRLHVAGRQEGYLREKTQALLVIATMAGDNYVSWS